MNGSMRRASFGAMYCATSKPTTSPAKRVANGVASMRVIGLIPLLPARIEAHAVATSLPTGETIPSPVTTTRRLDTLSSLSRNDAGVGHGLTPPSMERISGLAAIRDVADCLAHGGDLLGVFVRDLDLELFFERHHQFDRIERISAEVIDERSVIHDLLRLDAQLFGDNRLDLLFNRAHC